MVPAEAVILRHDNCQFNSICDQDQCFICARTRHFLVLTYCSQSCVMSDRTLLRKLVDGYIRDSQHSLEKIIPTGINKICIEFYDLYMSYKGRFTKKTICEYGILVDDHNLCMKHRHYQAARLNVPIVMKQLFTYRWKMSIYCTDTRVPKGGRLCSADFVGVISDKCKYSYGDKWYEYSYDLKDCYGVTGKAMEVLWGDMLGKNENNYKSSFKRDDEVTVELDCALQRITFKLSDIVIWSCKLPERESWYPVVAVYSPQISVKFIPFE